IFDLVLGVAVTFFGARMLDAIGLGTYAEPRFFQMCVGLFLFQYVYVQWMAFRDPRAHSTCVNLTLLIRLTFPIVYISAIVLWGRPWTLLHWLLAISAAGDLATSGAILLGTRRFGIRLFQGDAEGDRPAPDSPWLRRILLALAIAEFSISLNW